MPKKRKTAVAEEAEPPEPLYDTATWKGARTVYRYVKCGTFRETRDAMIEHVLSHFPLAEQEGILNQLIKES
jgi:hypothetical protein